MSYTRGQYCQKLMVGLGAPAPIIGVSSPAVLDTYYWVIGWSVHESAAGQSCPLYNLFGCGERVAGSKDAPCSTHGVQEYQSIASSVLAMSTNLLSPLYIALHTAIVRYDVTALSTSAEIQAELGTWISGSRSYSGYNRQTGNFIALGKQHINDSFPDSSTGGNTGGSTGSTSTPDCSNLPAGSSTIGCPPGTYHPLFSAPNTCVPCPAKTVVQSGTGVGPFSSVTDFLNAISNPVRDLKVVGGAILLLIAATMVVRPLAQSEAGKQVVKIAKVAT